VKRIRALNRWPFNVPLAVVRPRTLGREDALDEGAIVTAPRLRQLLLDGAERLFVAGGLPRNARTHRNSHGDEDDS